MPTSRNAASRWDFDTAKADGTLYQDNRSNRMGKWMPVEDGEWFWSEMDKTVLDISDNGKTITIDNGERRLSKTFNTVPIRLCRLVPDEGGGVPVEAIETIRLVLEFAKRDEDADNWNDTATYMNKRIDTALAWLLTQQQKGGE